MPLDWTVRALLGFLGLVERERRDDGCLRLMIEKVRGVRAVDRRLVMAIFFSRNGGACRRLVMASGCLKEATKRIALALQRLFILPLKSNPMAKFKIHG